VTRPLRTATYTAVNLWTLACAVAFGAAGVLTIVLRLGPVFELAGAAIVVSLALLFIVRTSVTVERHGVRARLGLFGFPRRFVGMDTIKRAIVVNVRPLREFGGWGDRLGSATRAFVCRGGEALRLELMRGRAFVVTVDDARRAADRVNAFVDERQATLPLRPRKQRRARRGAAAKPWF
jgi:hypothetical protein